MASGGNNGSDKGSTHWKMRKTKLWVVTGINEKLGNVFNNIKIIIMTHMLSY